MDIRTGLAQQEDPPDPTSAMRFEVQIPKTGTVRRRQSDAGVLATHHARHAIEQFFHHGFELGSGEDQSIDSRQRLKRGYAIP